MPLSKQLPALFLSLACLLCFSTAVPALAQDWHSTDFGQDAGPGGPRAPGGPMEHSFRGGERGRWWDKPEVAEQVGITDDQKKQMDDIFQQHRLQLIDLRAKLEKDEVLLRPMLGADQLDEQKVLSQIDAIAQDRAELEKANARMLFGIRKVLTPDQWKKLQTIVHTHMADRENREWGGPGGDGWRGRGPDGANAPKGPDGGNGQAPPPKAPPNE